MGNYGQLDLIDFNVPDGTLGFGNYYFLFLA